MDTGFLPLLVAAAMVWTTLSFVKMVRAGQYGDALTILVLVLVGFGIAVLARESSFAGDFNLANASIADCVFVGFGFSSTARSLYEAKKAVDNSQSSAEPKLFENPPASE